MSEQQTDKSSLTATGPLAGLRVLDLTTVLFGPYATQILGDWGADIIKVESPAGDLWRNTGLARNRGMGGQFMAANRNKRSIVIDLKSAEGQAILTRLIPQVDVLVSNIRPAGMQRLGFGYEQCLALNSSLIYAVGTGFGQDGPWAKRPAFDEVVQAASGFAASIGSDDEPQFVASLVGDKVCALALCAAIAAALVHRERTGEGQMVEVPMLETMAAFNSIEMLGGHAFEPPIGPPGYNRMKARKPAKTEDGWLTMLPYTGTQWCRFFEAIQRPECIEEFSINDPVARANNIDRIYARMHEITPSRTTAQWESLLTEIDIPHASFTRMDQVDDQPHLQDVALFTQLEHPSEGTLVQARNPIRFSVSPASIRHMPPRLGEQTREILRDAGYAESQIDALRDAGVVAEPAPEPTSEPETG